MNAKTRREFLKESLRFTAAVPFLSALTSLEARATDKEYRRLVVLFIPNGVIPELWFPAPGTFTLPEMLQPLDKYKSRLLVIDGLANECPHSLNIHNVAVGALLTGSKMIPASDADGTPGGPSVDQVVAQFLAKESATPARFRSIEFGESVAREPLSCNRMVYSGPGTPVHPQNDPRLIFARVFGDPSVAARRKSVLDHVLADLKRLKKAVSGADATLLDSHLEAVRAIEQSLATPAGLAQCPKQSAPTVDGLGAVDRPKVAKQQIDLLVRALACRQTPVATLQFTNGQSSANFPWLGFSEGHHLLSHLAETEPEVRAKLIKINRWYAEQVAYLLDGLDAIPESGGDGSVLDHTVVVWMNDMRVGRAHYLGSLPVLVAGSSKYFKMGRFVELGRTPHSRFLVSVCRSMGMTIDKFGDEEWSQGGAIPELVGC